MADVTPENCKPASSYQSITLSDPVKIHIREGESQPITLPQLFESRVRDYGDRPALVSQDDKKNWITYSYQDYWAKTHQIARAFIKLGLEPRTSCGILAFNCPEWFFTQMATIFVGGVSAGIYLSNSAEAVFHILDNSGATLCVVDDSVQMAKVRSLKHRLPKLKSVVQIQGPYEDFIDSEDGYYSWSHVEKIGANDADLELQVEERLKGIVANECAILIYTSGTVGMPKGVMLSHDNIISATNSIVKGMSDVIMGQEVIVSYLPLNHIAGQVMDFFMGLLIAAAIYFADRNALKGTLIKTLNKAQPTRFVGVPRIFEKIQEQLVAAERDMSWLSRLIVNTARDRVENHYLSMIENDSKSTGSSWGYWIGSKITQKVRYDLGFSRCKTFLAGGAPSTMDVKRLFLSFDMKISEIYGMSETAGATNVAWDQDDLESCGKPLPSIEMKLANADKEGHGEICCRSRGIFMGYLNEPEKTKEARSPNGWLSTGDIGYFDSKGRLFITGRLKELIITSGGENIPPSHIEQVVLHELSGLSNAMLIGDKRKFLTILVTIKTEFDSNTGEPNDNLLPEALEWMESLGLPYVTLTEILNAGPCPKVLQSIQEGIDRANKNSISNAQKVQKFALLPHDFSIPTGELGPTLKLRRSIVVNKYTDIIENFYKST